MRAFKINIQEMLMSLNFFKVIKYLGKRFQLFYCRHENLLPC